MNLQINNLKLTENATLKKYDSASGELLEVIEILNGKIVRVITDKEELLKCL
jgi:hypothetical protein